MPDRSTWDESTLVICNYFREGIFEASCEHFCNGFINGGATRDGTVVVYGGEVVCFGNESDGGMVDLFEQFTFFEEVKNGRTNIVTDDVP